MRSILHLFRGFIGILLYKANKVGDFFSLNHTGNVTRNPAWLTTDDDNKKYRIARLKQLMLYGTFILGIVREIQIEHELVIDLIQFYGKES